MLEKKVVKASGLLVYKNFPPLNHVTFLLLKSSKKPFHWTPPKGRLDEGEDDLTAAFRETKEESGLDRTSYQLDEGFVETLHYEAHGLPKECKYHLARLTDQSAQIVLSDEHSDFKWVKLEDVPNYCDKESLRTMFVKASDYINKKFQQSV